MKQLFSIFQLLPKLGLIQKVRRPYKNKKKKFKNVSMNS
jgi:hypothetical protein